MCIICKNLYTKSDTDISISNCDRLIEIPFIHSLKNLTIIGCFNLINLSSLNQNLESLIIIDCNSIESIPFFSKLSILNCSYCTNLKSIPNLPTLKSFKYDNCSNLSTDNIATSKNNIVNKIIDEEMDIDNLMLELKLENIVSFIKTDSRAIIPTKAFPSDIGFDITAIDIFKKINDNIILFETGIAVKPPEGYYIEIVPRSSIVKTGYMLANSIGIIDPNFRDSLKIACIRIDNTLPELQVPFCKFQLILRKSINYVFNEVKELDNTDRDKGGFGSTG
jgi:deoxyuridine 5'-triphosphate nucleotidohydrolase